MSQLSDFILPARNTFIVLPDAGDSPNTGTIVRNSSGMGCLFPDELPYIMDEHIIFNRESTVDIELDGTNYLLMNKTAIMGALE